MYKYEIEGGFPIKGKTRASGNKNSALPCIAASLLTDEPVTLSHVPEIEDVRVLGKANAQRGLGARAGFKCKQRDCRNCRQTQEFHRTDLHFSEFTGRPAASPRLYQPH